MTMKHYGSGDPPDDTAWVLLMFLILVLFIVAAS